MFRARDVVACRADPEAPLPAHLDLLRERHLAIGLLLTRRRVSGELGGEDRIGGQQAGLREPPSCRLEVGGGGAERGLRLPGARQCVVEPKRLGGGTGHRQAGREPREEPHERRQASPRLPRDMAALQ